MQRRFFLTALMAAPLAACVPEYEGDPPPIYKPGVKPEYIGRWIEVLLGGDGDGFELFGDGRAASIDQPDLDYVSWRAADDKLYLTTTQNGEVEYTARIDDVNGLHLSQADHDWPRLFRRID